MLFNIFVASAAIMFILFVFLYFTVMRRLKMLSSKNSVGSKVIGRRYDTAQNEQKSDDVCVLHIHSIQIEIEIKEIHFISPYKHP